MSFNLFSDIVDLKYDLILLSVENDLSHLAVLTEIVSEICNNSNRHGKASLSGTSSRIEKASTWPDTWQWQVLTMLATRVTWRLVSGDIAQKGMLTLIRKYKTYINIILI